ncbi:hypothetical protein GBAR_LOCUS12353 [Geodia barretti]|nr:hypothetical protein GBAR_LOCUS12353 [Geodia barretti]
MAGKGLSKNVFAQRPSWIEYLDYEHWDCRGSLPMLLRSPSSISEMTMDGFTILWCSGNRRVTILLYTPPMM